MRIHKAFKLQYVHFPFFCLPHFLKKYFHLIILLSYARARARMLKRKSDGGQRKKCKQKRICGVKREKKILKRNEERKKEKKKKEFNLIQKSKEHSSPFTIYWVPCPVFHTSKHFTPWIAKLYPRILEILTLIQQFRSCTRMRSNWNMCKQINIWMFLKG